MNQFDTYKLRAAIEAVSEKIAVIKSRSSKVNESNTIRTLITPVIEALGWDVENLDEVQSEYRHVSSDNPVDYALFLGGVPTLFVEAKALDENLEDRKWIVQAINYANTANVEWCVLTNGYEWRVYNVHAKKKPEEKLLFSVRLDGNYIDLGNLEMLAKDGMSPQEKALNHAWQQRQIDLEMREVLEKLPDNKAAIEAIAACSSLLNPSDVRESLLRINIAALFGPEKVSKVSFGTTCDLGQSVENSPSIGHRSDPKPSATSNDNTSAGRSESPQTLSKPPKVRMPHLVEAGLVCVGDRMSLRGIHDSIAVVVDGETCDVNGYPMTYNNWVTTMSGGKMKDVYSNVQNSQGVLMRDLRTQLIRRHMNLPPK